jgi:hypothetical protein
VSSPSFTAAVFHFDIVTDLELLFFSHTALHIYQQCVHTVAVESRCVPHCS